jgi:hypothetical protein
MFEHLERRYALLDCEPRSYVKFSYDLCEEL